MRLKVFVLPSICFQGHEGILKKICVSVSSVPMYAAATDPLTLPSYPAKAALSYCPPAAPEGLRKLCYGGA